MTEHLAFPFRVNVPIGLVAQDYASAVLGVAPVTYFPMTDPIGSTTIKDAVGSSTPSMAVVGGVTFGQPGFVASDPSQTSAHFDGATGYIQNSPSVTWQQATGFSIGVSIETTMTALGGIAELGVGSSSWWSLQIGHTVAGRISLVDGAGHYAETTAAFNDGRPHRIVVIMGAPASVANITIVVDGVVQALTTSGVWAPNNPAAPNLTIGSGHPPPIALCSGTLGQFFYCNTALSVAQARSLNTVATELVPKIVAATVEQDTYDDVAQSVQVLLQTVRGSRIELPAYGVDDWTFDTAIDYAAARAAIQRWEPRASSVFSDSPDTLDKLIRNVIANLQTQGTT